MFVRLYNLGALYLYMFYKIFETLCAEKNMTPNGVAKILSIPSGSITAYKKGSIPRGKTLRKIAEYFDVSPEYLLEEEKNPLSESQRILESVNSSENIDLLLHIIKNEASLSREQLLKLQGFVSALEAEDK